MSLNSSAGGANAAVLASGGGLKRVDEIEFYGTGTGAASSTTGGQLFANLNAQLRYWRRELASALGVQNMWDLKSGSGGGRIALY
jgi:hypothetical protein